MISKKIQQTLEHTQLFMKEIVYICILDHLGYVPGVCWSVLRNDGFKEHVFCMSGTKRHKEVLDNNQHTFNILCIYHVYTK